MPSFEEIRKSIAMTIVKAFYDRFGGHETVSGIVSDGCCNAVRARDAGAKLDL
jgi:hypothetical protein